MILIPFLIPTYSLFVSLVSISYSHPFSLISQDVASFLRESGATLNYASKRAEAISQLGQQAVKEEERVISLPLPFSVTYLLQ
jgi:hypothetical protein